MKKFDLTTLIGLIGCAFVVFMSMVWGKWSDIGGSLRRFLDIPSVFICVVGPIVTLLVAFEWKTIASVPSVLGNAFLNKEMPKPELMKIFVDLSKQSRREGVLSLEKSFTKIKDRYIKSGLQMVVDGFGEDTIRDIMGLEIDKTNERHKKCILLFRMWANLAPSLGMMGTFIGLVHMMTAFSDIDKFGESFATVVITSFYGVVLANMVFSPLANKLDIKNQEEVNRMEMILEGIVGLSRGLSPNLLEDSLKPFLSPTERLSYEVVHIKSPKGVGGMAGFVREKSKRNGKENVA